MKVIYRGPAAAVEVPAARVVAKRGEAVEVPDDIARALLEQRAWTQPAAPAAAPAPAAQPDPEPAPKGAASKTKE